ncbi:Protein of unknown function [Lactobacillus helveticus CIRM-BIA 953]|uniref:Uncharacterized protein n=1 Tax=Lactobacillus helveticus CIRM-BIA 953 TaxID=1226335 RepID=U4QAJ4_LACHE|nr:Protein of unknown function [Lactobacillus helveticus CIRM-BIA 953]
MEVNFSGG